MSDLDAKQLDWTKGDGLLPAVVQHWRSGVVLMLGYMNGEALAQTQQTGKVTFYSRSKQRLWTKGETSGQFLRVLEVRLDCDADAVLLRVESVKGIACHTGRRRCFFNKLEGAGGARRWVATEPVVAAADATDG